MNDHEPANPDPPPDSSSKPRRARVLRWVRELFTMRQRFANAERRLYAPSDPGFREFELGLLALKDAHQLGNSRPGRDTALLLYRSTIRLLVRAALLRPGLGSNDMSWPEVWALAGGLPGWPAAANFPEGAQGNWLDDVVKNEQGELHLATLSISERERALTGMKTLATCLAAPLEQDASGVRRLVWQRRLRVIVTALFAVSVLCWSIARVKAGTNLALHRPVVVSDRDPSFGVDPSSVVDGDRFNLGFHTTQRRNTVLTIDLQAIRPLSRVDVYNRADCCQERAPPLSLQLSSDGRHYKTVARQTRVFELWSVALPAATSARFIRVLHEGEDFFHLSEVEAY